MLIFMWKNHTDPTPTWTIKLPKLPLQQQNIRDLLPRALTTAAVRHLEQHPPATECNGGAVSVRTARENGFFPTIFSKNLRSRGKNDAQRQ